MQFFSSSSSVGDKARAVLGDLPEDPSPFEILQTVDQKAGDDADPDDVVAHVRDLDEEIDAKLATVEGQDVDQKDMREAAGVIAERTDMSQAGAMRLLSAVVDSIEQMDPAEFSEDFGEVVDEYYRADGNVDQAADTETNPDDSESMTENNDTDSGTDPDSDATPDADSGAGTDAGAGDVDQKQGDDDGGDGGGETNSPLEMLNADARETVENFAELAGIPPEDAVSQVLGTGGGAGEPAGADAAAADPAPEQPTPDRAAGVPDQKQGALEDLNLSERVANAVTSDPVIEEMAGAVAQKMADDDEFADSLVETVDQKGDFATTDDVVVTAPSTESETVGEARPLTGGNGGDSE